MCDQAAVFLDGDDGGKVAGHRLWRGRTAGGNRSPHWLVPRVDRQLFLRECNERIRQSTLSARGKCAILVLAGRRSENCWEHEHPRKSLYKSQTHSALHW